MTRKVCYVTGTRADFGLMQATLQAIHELDGLELGIVVTGMHLDPAYGNTAAEIEASGLHVVAKIPVPMEPATGETMARNIGAMIGGLVTAFMDMRPDVVLLLGDRGEMLAGALAGIHLNIPIAHIHGGELSGTVDEPIRHAISKLSHFHFVATAKAKERLSRMGERPEHIWITGAPGLDGLQAAAKESREELCADLGLSPAKPLALMVYHPVLQEATRAGNEVVEILDALSRLGVQIVALKPNSDAGSQFIREVLESRDGQPHIRIVRHFPRTRFVSWMAAADLMIGNSSAGIIEAATFGTPVINIGSRQHSRERNANVIDVPVEGQAIAQAISVALAHGRFQKNNVYGDGDATRKIVGLLQDIPLDGTVLVKTNAY